MIWCLANLARYSIYILSYIMAFYITEYLSLLFF
jgi:hypothetical protein